MRVVDLPAVMGKLKGMYVGDGKRHRIIRVTVPDGKKPTLRKIKRLSERPIFK